MEVVPVIPPDHALALAFAARVKSADIDAIADEVDAMDHHDMGAMLLLMTANYNRLVKSIAKATGTTYNQVLADILDQSVNS
jgi:hypothetical protein